MVRRQVASTSFTNAKEANTFASQKSKDGWYVTKRTVVKVSAEPPKRKPKAPNAAPARPRRSKKAPPLPPYPY